MNFSLSALLGFITLNKTEKECFAIDVGAHHGEYSNFLLKTGIFSKVIAFEPNPESYTLALAQVARHSADAFEVINAALSRESGTLTLYCDEDSATASLLPYESGYRSRGAVKKHSVSAFTLDSYLDQHPTPGKLGVIKIDTQGNDLAVIQGAATTITKHRPIIQTEFIYVPLYEGQCTPAELQEAFVQADYEMYSLNNLHVTAQGRLAFSDALFIPKELKVPMTQEYLCMDNQISLQQQIDTLTQICSERLAVIEVLDAEVSRLNTSEFQPNALLGSICKKIKSWVQ